MFFPAGRYRHLLSIFNESNLREKFYDTAGCGGYYIVTVNEINRIVSADDAPTFTQAKAMVGFDLTMNYLFDTSHTSSLDNYKVVVTGACPETDSPFDNAGYTVELDDYGYYYPISGFRPIDMVNNVATFNLNGPSGLVTYNCSCGAWIYRVLTGSEFENDAALQDLAVAIYAYANAGFNLFTSMAN